MALSALISTALTGGAGPLFADTGSPSPGFADSVRGAYLEIIKPGDGLRKPLRAIGGPFQKPKFRLYDMSTRVLHGAPKAAAELGHLRDQLEKLRDSELQWEYFERFEEGLADGLTRQGVSLSPRVKRMVTLVETGMLWYEAQYEYDRAALRGWGGLPEGSLPETLEMERRSRDVGCRLVEAGGEAGVVEGGDDLPDVFHCGEELPVLSYCRYSFAAEFVIVAARELRQLDGSDELVSDVDVTVEDRKEVLSRVLTAYCAELERGTKGNPLSIEGFVPEWGPGECVAEASKSVLKPGWRSSLELCPAAIKFGPDVRAAALELIEKP